MTARTTLSGTFGPRILVSASLASVWLVRIQGYIKYIKSSLTLTRRWIPRNTTLTYLVPLGCLHLVQEALQVFFIFLPDELRLPTLLL